jgi:transposase
MGSMQEEELIKQLRAENEQLKREIELLKDYIKELEARLAKYENAHTPPSLRRGRIAKQRRRVEIRENLAESSVTKA